MVVPLRSSLGDELTDDFCQRLGLLEMWPVAATVDHPQRRSWNRLLIEVATFEGHDLVLRTPHDERWQPDLAKRWEEGRIIHVGAVAHPHRHRASGFAHQLGFWWAVTGLDYFFGYVDMMARQSPKDLQSYAAKYIIGKPHVTGVLLSPELQRVLKLTPTALLDRGVRP